MTGRFAKDDGTARGSAGLYCAVQRERFGCGGVGGINESSDGES